jgi:hypothetical protein
MVDQTWSRRSDVKAIEPSPGPVAGDEFREDSIRLAKSGLTWHFGHRLDSGCLRPL